MTPFSSKHGDTSLNLSRNELHTLAEFLANRRAVNAHISGSGLSVLGRSDVRTTLKDLLERCLAELHKS